jgi:urea transport system permease protein
MGMYLMRQIGDARRLRQPDPAGLHGVPELEELPWYWYGFDMFWFAMLMVLLVPGLLAFVFGWFAFRSRVTGVYLSIITQALTYALMLAFFRNEMGFGGNNGLTDFKDILGFDLQATGHARRLFAPRDRRWRSATCHLPARQFALGKVLVACATPRAGPASSATGWSTTSCSSSSSRR